MSQIKTAVKREIVARPSKRFLLSYAQAQIDGKQIGSRSQPDNGTISLNYFELTRVRICVGSYL